MIVEKIRACFVSFVGCQPISEHCQGEPRACLGARYAEERHHCCLSPIPVLSLRLLRSGCMEKKKKRRDKASTPKRRGEVRWESSFLR
jgi:hypothetical protein